MALSSAELSILISATDQISAPLASARAGLTQMGEAVARLAGGAAGDFHKVADETENAGRKATEAGGLFREMGKSLAEVGKIAAGFALGGIALSAAQGVETLFTSIEELGHQTHSLQLEIGGTAESVSGMLAVFERFGVTNEQASVALGIFAKNITTYNDESQKAQSSATGLSGAVERLGLTFKDSSGATLSINAALLEVADKFAQMPNGVEKTADAMALFGRSGRDMIPVLNQGREGIQLAIDTAQKYGLVLSTENVEAVYKFGQAQRDLSEVVKGFSVQVGSLVLPVLTSFIQGITSMAETFNTSVLPVIRSVVEYISNTFGPYIQVGLALAGDAFNALSGVVSGALSSVLSIVMSVGQAIADALSWLNPFAEHSPSLVSQVQDGMSAISTAVEGSATSIKGSITDIKDQLVGVTDALKNAQDSLTNWGKTPIEGSKAYQDQLDAIDTKTKQLQLTLTNLKLGNDITPQVQALNDQLASLRLQPVGTGKDAAAAHQAAIKSLEQQLNSLKMGGAQDQIKVLNDQITQLGLQSQKVKLEESLDLGPKQKQIKDAINPPLAEKPFQAIIDGAKAAKAAVDSLTPQKAGLEARLKIDERALSAMTAAATKGAGASTALATSFKEVTKTVDEGKAKIAEWGKRVDEAREGITKFADKIIGPVASAFNALKGYLDPTNKFDLMASLFGEDLGHGIDEYVRGIKGALTSLSDIPTQIKEIFTGKFDLDKIVNGWLAIMRDGILALISYVSGDAGLVVGIVKAIIGRIPLVMTALGQLTAQMGRSITGTLVPRVISTFENLWKRISTSAEEFLLFKGTFLYNRVKSWLDDTWAQLHDVWPSIWAKAGDLGASFITWAGDLGSKVFIWLQDAWSALSDKWPAIWAQAGDVGATFVTWAGTLGRQVLIWLQDAWSTLSDKWPDIWSRAGDITGGLTIDGVALLERIKTVIGKVATDLKGDVTALFVPTPGTPPPSPGKLPEKTLPLPAKLPGEAAPPVPVSPTSMFKGDQVGAVYGPSPVAALLSRVVDTINAGAPPIMEALGKWAAAFGAWVGPAAVQFLKDWPKLLNTALDAIGDSAAALAIQLDKWAIVFVRWLGPALPGILLVLAEIVVGMGIFILETAFVLEQRLERWANAIIAWVAPAIPKLLVAMIEVGNALNQWITDQANGIAAAAVTWGAALVSGMLDGLKDLASTLITSITAALRKVTLDVGPFHLSAASFTLKSPETIGVIGGGITAAAEAVGGATASITKSVPTTVTNNVPITQNFYGNPTPSDVQSASGQGVNQALRASGAR